MKSKEKMIKTKNPNPSLEKYQIEFGSFCYFVSFSNSS